MINKLEIIVSLRGESKPKVVRFTELYKLKDSVKSIMFLWNTNSYYVNIEDCSFIVNGGRKVEIPKMGECRLLYRKRTAQTLSITGGEEITRSVKWIIGLEAAMNGSMIMLQISEDGKSWEWANTL